MVCVDNVATKDDTIDICVSWRDPLGLGIIIGIIAEKIWLGFIEIDKGMNWM